ncbi:glycosyltransferase involved in cell wall biosynthesis [Pararhizobium capsulatum DSM 1112]|uniref:Glycosyltransferase involved in cell wall biosynthesis n=1 Tax=Pararhizobium capsulatum DSM 1112 TaxID=1121113 RepID=A0ABU0BVA2_9HYPH|nr:glycosyltransferase family A protein [Pararhizobium capsulatum]MDQ0322181.1 glycosyltransferase involved in cell wall biosynthesis [Pararhizobium capsulatum DSM 1112]
MKPDLQLSVIIPHLNEADNLRRCLQSLDDQRREDLSFEIIVVDNGSVEPPYDVCNAVTGVRLEREAVPGPGPARNHGAEVARGAILAFIDADCIAEPGWVRSIVQLMEERPDVDFAGGDIAIQMTDPDRPSAVEAYESIYSYRARLYVERHGYAATGNMAVRARVFSVVGPFGGISTMEDTEWGQRATKLGYRAVFLPEAKVLTPSCKSFPELATRWDRHIAHEFRRYRGSLSGMLRWCVYCAVVAFSPAGEIPGILRSSRISGARSRWLAFTCVTRIRLYRARKMMELVYSQNAFVILSTWNRNNS